MAVFGPWRSITPVWIVFPKSGLSCWKYRNKLDIGPGLGPQEQAAGRLVSGEVEHTVQCWAVARRRRWDGWPVAPQGCACTPRKTSRCLVSLRRGSDGKEASEEKRPPPENSNATEGQWNQTTPWERFYETTLPANESMWDPLVRLPCAG